jgi:hypothetical protein
MRRESPAVCAPDRVCAPSKTAFGRDAEFGEICVRQRDTLLCAFHAVGRMPGDNLNSRMGTKKSALARGSGTGR